MTKHYLSFLPLFMCLAQSKRAWAAIVLIAFGVLAPLLIPLQAQAQTIYRCPAVDGITPYTNDKAEADVKRCMPMTGGNLTVVQGTRVQNPASSSDNKSTAPVRVATAPQAGSRVDGSEQRSRDSDSRQILESELKKAESKQADLLNEYNNGEPDKRGDEARNHQKYLDRVAELKASIARNDSDIASIKREIGRAPSKTAAAQ
jgi:hypothetical protein